VKKKEEIISERGKRVPLLILQAFKEKDRGEGSQGRKRTPGIEMGDRQRKNFREGRTIHKDQQTKKPWIGEWCRYL